MNLIKDIYKEVANNYSTQEMKRIHQSGNKMVITHTSLGWAITMTLWTIAMLIYLVLILLFSGKAANLSNLNPFNSKIIWDLPTITINTIPHYFNSAFVLSGILLVFSFLFTTTLWYRYLKSRKYRKEHPEIYKWKFYYDQGFTRVLQLILFAIYLIYLSFVISFLPHIYAQQIIYFIFMAMVLLYFAYDFIFIRLKEIHLTKEILKDDEIKPLILNQLHSIVEQNRIFNQSINQNDNSHTNITYINNNNSKTYAVNSPLVNQHNISDIKSPKGTKVGYNADGVPNGFDWLESENKNNQFNISSNQPSELPNIKTSEDIVFPQFNGRRNGNKGKYIAQNEQVFQLSQTPVFEIDPNLNVDFDKLNNEMQQINTKNKGYTQERSSYLISDEE